MTECCSLLVPVEVFNSLEKKHYEPILKFMYSAGRIVDNPESVINSRVRSAKEERVKIVPREIVYTDFAKRARR